MTDEPPSYDAARPTQPAINFPILRELHGKRVVLASASPRRKQLLAQMGFTDIETVPSGFEENLDKHTLGPFAYCLGTATRKALDVYEKLVDLSDDNPPALVIAADTIVLSHNTILEKPTTRENHLAMLRHLRDVKSHKVFTGVACIAPLDVPMHPGYCLRTTVEETTVTFGTEDVVTDDVLQAYVDSGEGSDAAGGYKIQQGGGVLVSRIHGDYGNVVGLPIHTLFKLIKSTLHPEDEEEAEPDHI